MSPRLPVSPGAVVSVTYVMRDDAGGIVEYVDVPVDYVHGAEGGSLLPKVERALEGHVAGDRLQITLSPEEGFGPKDEGLVFTDDLENVPPELRRLGARFSAESADGRRLEFRVSHIADGRLTVDANHPFAGRTIVFDVTVRNVRPATDAERRSGIPGRRDGLQ
ncbi:MAG: FKBP-type peptidyl-prolyl cis-trans isomerase [Acidiferrobacteraceae bacterium]